MYVQLCQSLGCYSFCSSAYRQTYKTRPIRQHHSIDVIEEKGTDHAGGEVDGQNERAEGATKGEFHPKNAEVF